MISGEARPTRCVMGRLEEGEAVVDGLVALARFEKIDAGFVRGHGSVEAVELLRYDPGSRRYVPLVSTGGCDSYVASASSWHPGGANFAFMDGHAKAYSASASLLLYPKSVYGVDNVYDPHWPRCLWSAKETCPGANDGDYWDVD